MSRPDSLAGRQTSWTLGALGFFAIGTFVVSCAGFEVELGTAPDETDGGIESDASARPDDAAGDVDSGACAQTSDGACDDFEWYPVNTNHPPGIGIAAVWGSGANDVWLVGAAGIVDHWDGNEWTSMSVKTNWSLQAVWGTGPNDVWIVSAANKIFHSTGFAGADTTWSPVTPILAGEGLGITNVMRTIWGTSPSDIWVAGDIVPVARPGSYSLEGAWRTAVVDDGIEWAPIVQGETEADVPRIRGIWGSESAGIWMVGYTTMGNTPRPFTAHANGPTGPGGGAPAWTQVDTQSRSLLHAVWGSGPGDVWAVGDFGTIRHFTGTTEMWSVVDSPTRENLRGLWGAGPKDIWAVGEHGTLLHYDGTSWRHSTAALPPDDKPNLYSVWGSGPSDVWAVGSGRVLHFAGFKQGATP